MGEQGLGRNLFVQKSPQRVSPEIELGFLNRARVIDLLREIIGLGKRFVVVEQVDHDAVSRNPQRIEVGERLRQNLVPERGQPVGLIQRPGIEDQAGFDPKDQECGIFPGFVALDADCRGEDRSAVCGRIQEPAHQSNRIGSILLVQFFQQLDHLWCGDPNPWYVFSRMGVLSDDQQKRDKAAMHSLFHSDGIMASFSVLNKNPV